MFKYLGDIISRDGKNTANIKARQNKGKGVITTIMSLLQELCLGKYYFEVAAMLRNSILISSVIYNSGALYNITNSENAHEICLQNTPGDSIFNKLFNHQTVSNS